MAFDGGFTYKMISELNTAVNSHIDKIYQPSRDVLVFLLRKKGFAKKLLISAKSGSARVQFTDEKFDNPASPPMFCMLTRKYFSSARFLGAVGKNLERVIELNFETVSEMGDRVTMRIICELIGSQSNIILVSNDGRILDAVRRSDIETSRRLIQPGAVYEYPESQGKLNPTVTTAEVITDRLSECGDIPLSKALLTVIDGFSPLICREISHRIGSDDRPFSPGDRAETVRILNRIISNLKGESTPCLLLKPDGTPADFSYTDITQYGAMYNLKEYPTLSELLDAYYRERESAANIQRLASDILKLLNTALSRAEKRLNVRREELKSCRNRENLRIYGELIKANLHILQNGIRVAEVQNFYDENLATIKIPLDPALSPAANAAKYFKDYKKSYNAEQTLTKLIETDGAEIEYLQSVLESISRCTCAADISEIRQELSDAGYIRTAARGRKREISSPPAEFKSREGYRILVGKNNTQNDSITTRLASKGDLWFHVKGIPGSHVVVMCGGNDVSEETVLFAARLAAKNSKASTSSNVPVDYTPIKFVKKPNGAKPGMVIYTTNKTVFVTPEESL